jgi:hypothetical protein
MFSIAMSKPHVSMVMWESLMDSDPKQPTHGVVGGDRKPKPILETLLSLRRALSVPLGEWKSADGKSALSHE